MASSPGTRHSKVLRRTLLVLLLGVSCALLYRFNYISHLTYSNEDFHIATYTSTIDQDADGVDDQTDILASTRAYIATEPIYKSAYYDGGYPDDQYGVCTDVIAFGLLGAGYDLQALMDADIHAHPEWYTHIDTPDRNIDFRRVPNVRTYLKHHAIVLTKDVDAIEQWQGGDIVVFNNHIGIISDKRNHKGQPFVIHHANPVQKSYEEDILGYRHDITGHFRIS